MNTPASPPPRLPGMTAIVTGASRRIGLDIAYRLVTEGARVCITARKPEPLSSAFTEFPLGSVIAVAGRADDPDYRSSVFDAARSSFGRLGILVSNAGVNASFGPLVDLDLGVARKIVKVKILATLARVQDAVRARGLGFAEQDSVISLSPVTAQLPALDVNSYGVSKATLEQFTRALAVELGSTVRVNAAAPSVVKTHFAKALYEDREDELSSHHPLGRLGEPDDVAAAIAFLSSSDSSWITDQVHNSDGGLLVAGRTA